MTPKNLVVGDSVCPTLQKSLKYKLLGHSCSSIYIYIYIYIKTRWLFVRKRTIPTKRPQWPTKLVSTFALRICCVVNAMDPYGRLSRFPRPEPLLFFQVVPQLFSRGWVYPVTDRLLPSKFGSAGYRIRDFCLSGQLGCSSRYASDLIVKLWVCSYIYTHWSYV
jgi:hypothetical protein